MDTKILVGAETKGALREAEREHIMRTQGCELDHRWPHRCRRANRNGPHNSSSTDKKTRHYAPQVKARFRHVPTNSQTLFVIIHSKKAENLKLSCFGDL